MGPEAGSFLGSILVSKILFAGLERQSRSDRPFHGVYIDEFHNFTRGNSPEFILSETRKYNIGLTLADQTIAQLPEGSEDAIFGNASTIIAGRLRAKDAERVSREIGLESAQTLQGLANCHWYVRTVNEKGDASDPLRIRSKERKMLTKVDASAVEESEPSSENSLASAYPVVSASHYL